MKNNIIHFGAWLRLQIDQTGLPVADFVRRTGISEPTVYRWFKLPAPRIQGHEIPRIALGLGVDRAVIDAVLVEAWKADPKMQAKWKEQEQAIRAAGSDVVLQLEAMKNTGIEPSLDVVLKPGLNGLPDAEEWFVALDAKSQRIALERLQNAASQQGGTLEEKNRALKHAAVAGLRRTQSSRKAAS